MNRPEQIEQTIKQMSTLKIVYLLNLCTEELTRRASQAPVDENQLDFKVDWV